MIEEREAETAAVQEREDTNAALRNNIKAYLEEVERPNIGELPVDIL